MQVVGTSRHWYEYEERNGICHECSGTGKLATTDRAAKDWSKPPKYPDELIDCPDCGGSGKAKA